MTSALCRASKTASAVLVAVGLAVSPSSAEESSSLTVRALGGAVLLRPENMQPHASGVPRKIRVLFPQTTAPVLGPRKIDPGHQSLRRLFAAGQAAGNAGDLYENRDRGHSSLSLTAYPQLTEVLYDEALRKQRLDYGLAQGVLFDAPLIGNSSTAVKGGKNWRSLPRLALTVEGGAERLFQNYAAGQIHVYPEHRDHDPERGDLFPANTPYVIISQGSSGSDRPHLEALASILAAFRPDTKETLKRVGLISPTVQMVYRRARAGVRSREAYLSGAAHPSVFRAQEIDLARAVSLANSIKPDEIPPMVELKVLEETAAIERVDYFGEGLSERLFDTPSAIARVWRSRTGRRSMVVTAADTRDPNGRELRFDWVVLRGDQDRIRIIPLTPEGRYALIEMEWQDPRPVPGFPDLLSHRIDIGVFANNGIHDSAPAFISVLLPTHERRDYDIGPNGKPRVLRIDRRVAEGTYADPLIYPVMSWSDRYQYDAEGHLTGWLRQGIGGEARYDRAGRRLSAEGGSPILPVLYPVERDETGALYLTEVPQPPPAE